MVDLDIVDWEENVDFRRSREKLAREARLPARLSLGTGRNSAVLLISRSKKRAALVWRRSLSLGTCMLVEFWCQDGFDWASLPRLAAQHDARITMAPRVLKRFTDALVEHVAQRVLQ